MPPTPPFSQADLPLNLFSDSLLLINESTGRILDVLTHPTTFGTHTHGNQEGEVDIEDEDGDRLGRDEGDDRNRPHSHPTERPLDWTPSDLTLRTLHPITSTSPSLLLGVPHARAQRLLGSLSGGGVMSGVRDTRLYRESLASFYTAIDDGEGNAEFSPTNTSGQNQSRNSVLEQGSKFSTQRLRIFRTTTTNPNRSQSSGNIWASEIQGGGRARNSAGQEEGGSGGGKAGPRGGGPEVEMDVGDAKDRLMGVMRPEFWGPHPDDLVSLQCSFISACRMGFMELEAD